MLSGRHTGTTNCSTRKSDWKFFVQVQRLAVYFYSFKYSNLLADVDLERRERPRSTEPLISQVLVVTQKQFSHWENEHNSALIHVGIVW